LEKEEILLTGFYLTLLRTRCLFHLNVSMAKRNYRTSENKTKLQYSNLNIWLRAVIQIENSIIKIGINTNMKNI
jgi:hypothetical protein